MPEPRCNGMDALRNDDRWRASRSRWLRPLDLRRRQQDQPEGLARLCRASLRHAPMDDGAAPRVRSVEHAHCPQAVGHLLPSRRSIPAACASLAVSKSSGSASGSSPAASVGVASNRRSSTETGRRPVTTQPRRRNAFPGRWTRSSSWWLRTISSSNRGRHLEQARQHPLALSSIQPRRGVRRAERTSPSSEICAPPAPARQAVPDAPARAARACAAGGKAAGLDLDQQVAADEVDDETDGDLLEQVAGTAVPIPSGARGAPVSVPTCTTTLLRRRCRVACARTRIGSCVSTPSRHPLDPRRSAQISTRRAKDRQKFVAFLDDMTERESRSGIPGQATRCKDVARE
jgi:hypothetical protein